MGTVDSCSLYAVAMVDLTITSFLVYFKLKGGRGGRGEGGERERERERENKREEGGGGRERNGNTIIIYDMYMHINSSRSSCLHYNTNNKKLLIQIRSKGI